MVSIEMGHAQRLRIRTQKCDELEQNEINIHRAKVAIPCSPGSASTAVGSQAGPGNL
jgi:hypothetical protein